MSSLPSTSAALKRKQVLTKNWYNQDSDDDDDDLLCITPKLRKRNTLPIHSDEDIIEVNDDEDDDDSDDANDDDHEQIDAHGYTVLKKTFAGIKYKFNSAIRKQEFCSIVKTSNLNVEKTLVCSKKTISKVIQKIESLILNQLSDIEENHRLAQNYATSERYPVTKRFKVRISKFNGFWYIDTRKYIGSGFHIPSTNGISLTPSDAKKLIASMKKALNI